MTHLKTWKDRSWWRPLALVLAVALVAAAPTAQAQPPVEVTVDVAGNPVPGGVLTATAKVAIKDGSKLQSIAWSQLGGVPVAFGSADQATTTVALGARGMYRMHVHELLAEPPIGPGQLPPNVPPPEGEFPGGLQNRFEVSGVNPFALEGAGLVTLQVAATTTSGTYFHHLEIHTALPWKPATGIRSVPIGSPVLLHGKAQDPGTYDWALTVPAGSQAFLDGATSRTPEFTPDVPGIYVVQVTDADANLPVRFEVYAGTWRGVVVAQNAAGRPVAEGLCTACHRPGFVVDKFTPWMQTGHAEIFTDMLNTNTHYGPNCFGCHTVGFDPSAANRGFDEASDYQAFLGAGLINNPGNNWTQVLNLFPNTAKLANIQCENCHGPANSAPGLDTLAHGWMVDVEGEPRVSLSSDVCAVCHGEPLRHARFQQWQLSGHANYELAIDESGSGSCSRCHTANGFLVWLDALRSGADPRANIDVTWTADEAHPQTCVACHDPHDIGTTTGITTNAKVRVLGFTPPLPSGYQVFGAGRGAICMTCHNQRNGLYNDDVFADVDITRAPHTAAQTDVLMGESAYLVQAGIRGRHSLIGDTCVNCHMEKTPPPELLSYNLGGTNHTFYARHDVCNECHEGLEGTGLFEAVEAMLHDLEAALGAKLHQLLAAQLAAGNQIDLGGQRTINSAGEIAGVVFGETRGRHALAVNFTDGTTVGLVRMPDVEVVRPAPLPPVGLYDVADPGLVKAAHNYLLIEGDGSHGAHNPSFVLAVLAASRSALGVRGGARLLLPTDLPELRVDDYLKD